MKPHRMSEGYASPRGCFARSYPNQSKLCASLVIKDASTMKPALRLEIVVWLRKLARDFRNKPKLFSDKFRTNFFTIGGEELVAFRKEETPR